MGCTLRDLGLLLSDAERIRAEAYRLPKDCDSYILRHGIQRILLGWYRKKYPREIEFSYGLLGKPELTSLPRQVPLHFSHSHSEDLALYAMTRACPVGLDIEWVAPLPEKDRIAGQFFSPREAKVLAALPSQEWLEAFYKR